MYSWARKAASDRMRMTLPVIAWSMSWNRSLASASAARSPVTVLGCIACNWCRSATMSASVAVAIARIASPFLKTPSTTRM